METDDPTQFLIDAAIREDLGDAGDVTSAFFVPAGTVGEARIFVKEEPAVLSGAELAVRTLLAFDEQLEVRQARRDGDALTGGETVLTVRGSLRSILTAERTTLNFIQRLSGIATLTRRYVDAVSGTGARILDTRKTTAGWRHLEKQAVRHGGGTNHRFGLHDAVMVKDNHLLARPGFDWLARQCAAVRREAPHLTIELEADTLEQFERFLAIPEVDSILLDNMPPETLRRAVARRDRERPDLLLEASGGIRLETVAAIAAAGVDFISVGALTHSAPALDFSLEILSVDAATT